MNTLAKLVTETIDELERQNQPPVVESGPKWVSDAEREALPLANQAHSGAPSLRTDEVLKRSEPNHDRRKG